jgi:hypothetical protein
MNWSWKLMDDAPSSAESSPSASMSTKGFRRWRLAGQSVIALLVWNKIPLKLHGLQVNGF